ncbi:MAG: hypothetical protein D4R67_10815, partial [Bacteroidetes bacterium]
CTQCHNFDDALVAKIFQYESSQHATGSTTFENRTTCAPCHTSQGFRECIETGAWATAEAVENASRIDCRTCHEIHKTYTDADYVLRWLTPFVNILGETTDMTTESGNVTGNLCARCHQIRAASPPITDPTSTTDSLAPTSSRYGPHHGPQSAMLAGTGGYVTGSKYANSYHTGRTTCVDCHGATAVGNYTGGHSLRMASDAEGDNYNGCNIEACHNGAIVSFDYDGKQTIIEEKLVILLEKLQAAGVANASGLLVTGKSYCQKMLAVFYNYQFIEADRSLGVHNYKRANGMLDDGIAYLESLGY